MLNIYRFFSRNNKRLCFIYIFILLLLSFPAKTQTTSWVGREGKQSSDWFYAPNWTNGVPDSATTAIIGDTHFSGEGYPVVRRVKSRSAACKELIIKNGAHLKLQARLMVNSHLKVDHGAILDHQKGILSVAGNWQVNGEYTAKNNTQVLLQGNQQSLQSNHSLQFTSLTIHSGSRVTLETNIAIQKTLHLYGTLDPQASYAVEGTGKILVHANARLRVKARQFADNYPLAKLELKPASIVAYVAESHEQYIADRPDYSTILISGDTVKYLQADLSLKADLLIREGALDQQSYQITGSQEGEIYLANHSRLRIGATASFPQGFRAVKLGAASTVIYDGASQSLAPLRYGHLILRGEAGNVEKTTTSGKLIVQGNFIMETGSASALTFTPQQGIDFQGQVYLHKNTVFNAGSYDYWCRNAVINFGTLNGQSSQWIMAGDESRLFGSGQYNLYILKSRSTGLLASDTVQLNIQKALLTEEGGTFRQAAGENAYVNFTGASASVSGDNIHFGNLRVDGSLSPASAYVIELSGHLTVEGSLQADSGVFRLSGIDKEIAGSGTLNFSSLMITGRLSTSRSLSIGQSLSVYGEFSAHAGTVLFSGDELWFRGTAGLHDVTIEGDSLHLNGDSDLGIAGNLTLRNGGGLDVTTSLPNTIRFNGNQLQAIPALNAHHLVLANASVKEAMGELKVYGNLSIQEEVTFKAGAYVHQLYGDWINRGNFIAAESTISLQGTNTTQLIGETAFKTLELNKTAAVSVGLETNVSVNLLRMTAGVLHTKTHVLTITGERKGEGLINGIIRRKHAFTTGVEYAFASPQNSLKFSSISGSIRAVTMKVRAKTIPDFPYQKAVNRVFKISTERSESTSYRAELSVFCKEEELNGNEIDDLTIRAYLSGEWKGLSRSLLDLVTSLICLKKEGLSEIELETRWTLSAKSKVYAWTGAVSNDWNNALNWDRKDGLELLPQVPDFNDQVILGAASFDGDYQPVISDNVRVKDVIFRSSRSVRLQLASGGELEVKGSVFGDWSEGTQAHELKIGSQQMLVGGNLWLADDSDSALAGEKIDVTLSGGELTVEGDLYQANGATLNLQEESGLQLKGDFLYEDGRFTADNSTVSYTGKGGQQVAGLNYYHLTIDKPSGQAHIDEPLAAQGDFFLKQGAVSLNAAMDIKGNYFAQDSTKFFANASTITIQGSWTDTGDFKGNSSRVKFTGNQPQSLRASALGSIEINKSNQKVELNEELTMTGDLFLEAGTLDLNGFELNKPLAGDSIKMQADSRLLIGGNSSPMDKFTSVMLDERSEVVYNGDLEQRIAPVTFGNLRLKGASTKKIVGTARISGDLMIESGATLNLQEADLLVAEGDVSNEGDFIAGVGTVELAGSGKSLSGDFSFHHLLVTGSYTVSAASLEFKGHLHVQGQYDLQEASGLLHGNLINEGTLSTNGEITLSGRQRQILRLEEPVSFGTSAILNFEGEVAPVFNAAQQQQFATVNLYTSAPIAPTVSWNVLQNFTIGSAAIFNAGALTHTFQGDFVQLGTLVSDGRIRFAPTEAAEVRLAGPFNGEGIIEFGGSGQIQLTESAPAYKYIVISNSVGLTPSQDWQIEKSLLITEAGVFNVGNRSVRLSGQITNNGLLNGETSRIAFADTAVLAGSGRSVFNHLDIKSGAYLTVLQDVSVQGDLTHDGDSLNFNHQLLTFTGNRPSKLQGSSAVVLSGLEIAKNGTALRLMKPLTLTKGVALNSGALKLNGYGLTLENPLNTALSRNNGYIIAENTTMQSRIHWQIGEDTSRHLFPFGNRSGKYIPVSFKLDSGNIGTFSISTYGHTSEEPPLPPGISGISSMGVENRDLLVNRFWETRVTGQASAELEFVYTSSEADQVDYPKIHRWNDSSWVSSSFDQTSRNDTIYMDEVSNYSTWGISGSMQPLPVALTNFRAITTRDFVMLKWETSFEKNNDYFEIQRSVDAEIFEKIGKVQGVGNSSEQQKYGYIDKDLWNDHYYYRLLQVDFDGTKDYSSIISVRVNEEAVDIFRASAYPNPLEENNTLLLRLKGLEDVQVVMTLFNVNGKRLWKNSHRPESEKEVIPLAITEELNKGLYFLKVQTNSISKVTELVVE